MTQGGSRAHSARSRCGYFIATVRRRKGRTKRSSGWPPVLLPADSTSRINGNTCRLAIRRRGKEPRERGSKLHWTSHDRSGFRLRRKPVASTSPRLETGGRRLQPCRTRLIRERGTTILALAGEPTEARLRPSEREARRHRVARIHRPGRRFRASDAQTRGVQRRVRRRAHLARHRRHIERAGDGIGGHRAP